ncbi:uncharacterized protein BJ212DRAFT_511448 [Suillus subaureus]|uniref:Uncharacterized protein n=1 Tax=Suillus subaureus TaxID=48587 RepID=A0A9P7E5F8_9AGAM|nr:uncharacterized protein BJ212DRAFT_511448 [Suillus subaureus]KAG1811450.1 hypothetical protein BJ212DRAFT_511448 [Suillus subaureus]
MCQRLISCIIALVVASRMSHVGYTKLCDALQRQRVARDTRDAAAARSFFGGNLDHLAAQGMFKYAKSGLPKLMNKDVDVARKWRELLTVDCALAQRWEGSPLADLQSSLLPVRSLRACHICVV